MSKIARETILAMAYFLPAGKENSQKQVLAYFERTAIRKPDSVFHFRPQRKIGYPDCSKSQFFKIFGFWENSLPACNLGTIPKIILSSWLQNRLQVCLVIWKGLKEILGISVVKRKKVSLDI